MRDRLEEFHFGPGVISVGQWKKDSNGDGRVARDLCEGCTEATPMCGTQRQPETTGTGYRVLRGAVGRCEAIRYDRLETEASELM